ncbi:hypothetical protein FEM03_19005 [Phragmitibacter flavus]|uniref:Uncharacterized protein n=1 Tax=Phragmitibacter flavus TaxID=2576071 RepID=A0A5R8KA41_9BACT|nr:hypothetical protein FEM03_19005 [Phragmitibacter flavus]
MSSARAEPAKLLESLKLQLASELKEGKEKKQGDDIRLDRADSILAQLSAEQLGMEERQSEVLQSLEEVQRLVGPTKTGAICRELIKEMKELRTKRMQLLKEKLDSTIRTSLVSGLDATKAADLDGPIFEILKSEKEIAYSSQRMGDERVLFNRDALQAVRQILTSIQDGFLAVEGSAKRVSRDNHPARQILSNSSSAVSQLTEFMPRSELLTKLQEVAERIYPALQSRSLSQSEVEKQIGDIADGVNQLEDLDGAIENIDELIRQQRELGGYYGDTGLSSQLRNYRRNYEDFQAGIGVSISFSSHESSSGMQGLTRVRDLLAKFALGRLLRAPADMVIGEDESSEQFLHRVLEKARSTSDWTLMSRVIDVAVTMRIQSVATTSDSSAMKQFLGANNLERAGQYQGAVAGYLQVLRSGSQLVSAEVIGKMLDDIKKNHPQAYEAGTQQAVTVSPSGAASSNYDRFSGRASYPPGFPGREPPAPEPRLVIPAVPKAEEASKPTPAPNATDAKPAKVSD